VANQYHFTHNIDLSIKSKKYPLLHRPGTGLTYDNIENIDSVIETVISTVNLLNYPHENIEIKTKYFLPTFWMLYYTLKKHPLGSNVEFVVKSIKRTLDFYLNFLKEQLSHDEKLNTILETYQNFLQKEQESILT
jgi:subtilase family serine protease